MYIYIYIYIDLRNSKHDSLRNSSQFIKGQTDIRHSS